MAGASSPRRSYWRLSSDLLLEEEGYGAELFHTYCKVGERACATTIDHDSSINAVGVDMVEKLELSTTPHPRPYSLKRCRDKLDITHQTMVPFSIGKFSCEVLCDVIPVPLVSCYLLLGELWYKERGAAYSHRDSTYTVAHGKEYVLKPLEKKIFRTWRNDRLKKIKEQVEAKKKEAKVARVFSAPVQSLDANIVEDTDLKPRTVSFEEGEDDTATHTIRSTIAYDFSVVKVVARKSDSFPRIQIPFTYSVEYKDDAAYRPAHELYSVTAGGANSYYFALPRPPEQIVDIFQYMYLPWKYTSLKETGWGPPACMASKDNVQDKNSPSYVC